MFSKRSLRTGTLDEKIKSFFALQINHNIACHTINSLIRPFPRPAAKQNISIDAKGSEFIHISSFG
ncbi:hypothetical protein TSUD_297180 [Trifolium subterraneum]|uniref:Uncharacterized protein n=1 Tax=Trifolium subterraneum TaxID=3900 RepID=A0A2Z6NX78_TRISU|nr:hypothetical protein TSUD_297180 [Trifolium subterraneum]